MPQTQRLVEVTVLGHQYPVRVPDTDAAEQRVRDAARLLSERLNRIADATGEAAGLHLAVMAGLSLADDLLEARWQDLGSGDGSDTREAGDAPRGRPTTAGASYRR